MKRTQVAPVLLFAGSLLFIGCGDDSTRTDTNNAEHGDMNADQNGTVEQDMGVDEGSVNPGPPISYIVPVTPVLDHNLGTSPECAVCHSGSENASGLRDSQGDIVAPFDLWQGSMKANAARDPLFHAVLSAEIQRLPQYQEAIEGKCMHCHAPLAATVLEARGEKVKRETVSQQDSIGRLGADGVSCVACHAMEDNGFGEESTFDGNFEINTDMKLYGPHANPVTGPMRNHTGFTPTEGQQILEAGHCATCHTLFTETVDLDGEFTGNFFPEQTPYLEWQNSVFTNEIETPGEEAATCQDCHVPTIDAAGNEIETRIARSPPGGDFFIDRRKPFGRHLFVGGNTLIPAIMRDNRNVLNPLATNAAFDATIEFATHQLQNQTATVAIENASLQGDSLSFDVNVQNMAGHKFPTGYPARRAWLRVIAKDSTGKVVFQSGQFNDRGIIVGDDDQPMAIESNGNFEEHHTTITAPDQVQIFEAVMIDSDAKTTVALMHASGYVKDNRLLPKGYTAGHAAYGDTQPRGVDGDSNFAGGGDVTHYEVMAAGAVSIEASLHYQTLGARWADDLFSVKTADIDRFKVFYQNADTLPVQVGTTTVTLP